MGATTFFVLLVLVPCAFTGPVNWDYQSDALRENGQCSQRCTASTKFQYRLDTTYQYNYEVTTSTSMHGASDDKARIDVTAGVNIRVVSKCEMVLTLSNVAIKRSDTSSNRMEDVNDWAFKMLLERNPLRFSFQDGRVEDLCPSDREKIESLNFKRGVLSAFQNSMRQHEGPESVQEVDVSGTCPTQYGVRRVWNGQQISKVKDLLGCADRNHFSTALQAAPFHAPSAVQSLPLIKGDYKCTQELSKEKIITSASCQEMLVFRPFSRQEAGAQTLTYQKLTYTGVSQSPTGRADNFKRRTTLLFEHQIGKKDGENTFYSTRETLAKICRVTVEDVSAVVPDLFTEMVYLMRWLTGPQFMDIAEGVHRGNICDNNKERGKKFFYDALPMVGTSSSVEMMVELLLNNDVTGVQAQIWLKSLHFLPKPTQEMLAHSKRLLLSNNHRMMALLPVTTLVSHYCKLDAGCVTNDNVQRITSTIKDILAGDCQGQNDLVLMALRAAGNLGVADKLANTFETCAQNSALTGNTRVAALQAYRAVSCAVDRNAPMDIFLNKGEDAELRIFAYLAVMQCANEDNLEKIKQQLEIEEVNQVGSFVWTHLTNLMETSSPYKQAVRNILQDTKLAKTLNLDQRKYSRNYELSYFSQDFGIGGAAEGNLIWSEGSFLPRSAMVNLTVDVLGHSVNLVEIGGRVEGVEKFLWEMTAKNVFKNGKDVKSEGPSRCTKTDKMDKMKDQFAPKQNQIGASMYLRIFGNELGYHSIGEAEMQEAYKNVGSSLFGGAAANGKDLSWTQSGLFMDSTMQVPTVAGMPLSLDVNASTTVDIRAQGKMDLKKLSMKKMLMSFDVRPSGAVQISGRMSLGLGDTRAGLKMVTTLHTSTALSGSLDLANGQVLTLELDTPKRNMDVLNVRSEFFIQHDKVDRMMEIAKGRAVSRRSCSSQEVLKYLGYQTCAEVSFVKSLQADEAPYYPLTGPTTLSLSVGKKDAPRGFKFIGKYAQNDISAIGLLSLDTPGSRVDRALSVGFSVDTKAQSAEFQANTPWTDLLAKGSYTVDKKSRKFNAIVSYDGKEHSLDMLVEKEYRKGKTTWISSINLERPRYSDHEPYIPTKVKATSRVEVTDKRVTGSLHIDTGVKPAVIDIKMDYANTQKLWKLSGDVTLDRKDVYSATAQVNHVISKNGASVNMSPTLLISAPKWRIFLLSGDVNYRQDKIIRSKMEVHMDKTLKSPIKLETKITKQKKGGASDRYRCSMKMNSQFVHLKLNGYANAQNKGKKVLSRVKMDYNIPLIKNRKERKNRLTFNSKFQDRSTKALTKYEVSLNCDNKLHPVSSFTSQAELSHKDSFTKARSVLNFGPRSKKSRDSKNQLIVEMLVDHKISENDANVIYNALLIYPAKNMEYQIKGKHEHHWTGKQKLETYVTTIYGKGKAMELRLHGTNRSKPGRMDMIGGLEISFPAIAVEGKEIPSQRYVLGTTLKQYANKDYVHTLNLQINGKQKHSMVTRLKNPTNMSLQVVNVNTKIDLDLETRTKVAIGLVSSPNSKEYSATYEAGKDKVKAQYKTVTDKMYQKNNWDISWPGQHIRGSLEGGRKKEGEGSLKFVSMWDVDKAEMKKIESDIFLSYPEAESEDKRYYFSFILQTPFEGHKSYKLMRLVEYNNNYMKEELMVIWKDPANTYFYSLAIGLPMTWKLFEFKITLMTPMDSLKKFYLKIDHKLDGSKDISTTVKTDYNDDDIELKFLHIDKSNKIRNDFTGLFSIKSSFPVVKDVLVKMDHTDDGLTYASSAEYTRNGRMYRASMSGTYMKVHYQVTAKATVDVEIPSERPMTIKVSHTNTLTNLNSSISLTWKPQYNVELKVGAKGSKAENNYALDVLFTAPVAQIDEFTMQLRQNMMSGYVGSANYMLNRKHWSSLSYSYTDTDFEAAYSMQGINAEASARYSRLPYTALFSVDWDAERSVKKHKILMDASVNNLEDFMINGKLVTPWEGAKNVDVQGTVKKLTNTKWELDSHVSLSVGQQITTNLMIDLDGTSMRGKIQTPFTQMSKLDFELKREQKQNVYDSQGYIELQPYFNKVTIDQSFSQVGGKIASRLSLGLPDTDIEKLEIIFDNAEHRRGYNSDLKVKYQYNKVIDLGVKTRYNAKKFPDKSKIILDLSTPYSEFSNMHLKADLDKKSGRWVGNVDFKTGLEALREMDIKFNHYNDDTSSATDVEISSSVFETVTAAAQFNWGNSPGANFTFVAPSVDRTSVGFRCRAQSWVDFYQKIFGEVNGKKLDLEYGVKFVDAESKIWLVYDHPGAKDSSFKASVHKIGNDFDDMDVGAYLKLGQETKPFNVSAQWAFVPGSKYALGTTLETPFTKHLSYLLKWHAVESNDYSSILYGKYGRRFLLDIKSSSKMGQSDYEQSTQVGYRFGNDNLRFGSTTSAQWYDKLQIFTLTAYKDNEDMTLDITRVPADKFLQSGTEKIDISLATPFERFSDIGLQATLDSHKGGAQHEGKIVLEYMDGQEAELNFEFTAPNTQRASLSASLNLPIREYSRTRISYNHKVWRNRYTADAEVIVGQGQRLAADFEFSDKQNFVLTVTGPVMAFESLVINGKYDEQQSKVNGDISYRLKTDPGPLVLKYDISLQNKPVDFNLVLTNLDGKKVSLRVFHDGTNWAQFKNVIDIKAKAAPQIGDWYVDSYFKFDSPTEIDLRSDLTTSNKLIQKANLKFTTTERFAEQLTESELGWHQGKKIKVSNTYSANIQGKNSDLNIKFDLSTPWKAIREGSIEFSHRFNEGQGLEQICLLTHNTRRILDTKLEYSDVEGRHIATVTFEKPSPMLFSLEGEVAHKFFDGKISADWNKNSPTSRFTTITTYEDKSGEDDLDTAFKLKINHPARIMGIDCLFKEGKNEFRSSGLVTWDENSGNTFSYDFGWANRTTRYSHMLEGHWKLGVPQRSVKYTGSYSNTGRALSTSSSFFWHADKDETKKVTMTTNIEQNDNYKRIGVNVNIPCINKQLNIGATTKGGYGKTLLDTKAEISYASDPKKTITVSSVISNSEPESSRHGYNYTMEVAVQHPVSGLDVMVTSHVANLRRVESVGSVFSFQDIDGVRQSAGAMASLDHANRLFDFRASTPIKSLGLRGQVKSGNRGRTLVSLVTFEDDREALKIGMVVDPKRRHMDMEFNYDPDNQDKLLSLSGGYLNDSSIQLELTSQASRRGPAQRESLLAMTLKSSQLMHTKVSWKPNVDQEIKAYLGTKLTEFSYATNGFLQQTVNAVGKEVKGKFLLASEELKVELKQVYDLMEKEMWDLNTQLDMLWTKIRRFHQENRNKIDSVGAQFSKGFQEFSDLLMRLVQSYGYYFNQVTTATQEWMDHLSSYPIAHQYMQAVNHVAKGFKEIEGALEDMLSIVVVEATKLIEEYYTEYQKLSRQIDRKLESYTQSINELPLYKKMVEQRKVFNETVPQWVEWYDAAYIKTQEVLQDQFSDFMTRDEFKHLFAVANELLGQIKHYKMDGKLGSEIKRASDLIKNLMLMELAKLKRTVMDFKKSRVLVFDPAAGELEFEMYVPMPMKSLSEMPEIQPEMYIAHGQRLIQTHVDRFKKLVPAISNSSVMDLYYDYMPSMQPSKWVPPFEASAFLIGSQRIITFDGYEFHFLSKCSHVLSRDIVGDLFSVTVNTHGRKARRDGIKSLCFTMGDLHFEIDTNYKLQVNNKQEEMPFITKEVRVVREGDFIHVEYIRGVEVLLNPALDMYKITVSGWFHGKLAGLMGTYNNEQHDDRKLPGMVGDFDVNRRSCNSPNLAHRPEAGVDRDGVCFSLFKDSGSKLRPCFKQVDPASFLSLCETYLKRMSKEEASRISSEQYNHVCQDKGVFMNADIKWDISNLWNGKMGPTPKNYLLLSE